MAELYRCITWIDVNTGKCMINKKLDDKYETLTNKNSVSECNKK